MKVATAEEAKIIARARTPTWSCGAARRTSRGDVTNFIPAAKTEGAWVIFSFFFLLLLCTSQLDRAQSAETPTRDLELGREVAFPFVNSLIGNFARVQKRLSCSRHPVKGFAGNV